MSGTALIRAVREDDLRFVRKTWRDSYSTSAWAQECTKPDEWERNGGKGGGAYWHGHKLIIETLIASSVVLVAEAGDGLLDGWICGAPRTLLHYVYVRLGARRRGVARELLDAMQLRHGGPVHYTHRTRIWRAPNGWSGYGWIPRREVFSMAMKRISYVKFTDGNTIPFMSKHGSLDQRDSLNESHEFVGWFDDAKKLITIECRTQHKQTTSHKIYVDLAMCRFVDCFPDGERPAWEIAAEKAGEKTAEVPKP